VLNFLFYGQDQNMGQIAGLCPVSQRCLCVPILFPEYISTGLKAQIKAGNTCQDKWF